VNTGEKPKGDRRKMIDSRQIRELIVLGIIGVTVFFALMTYPFEELASFNPVEWIANSVKEFFDWFINLFFGWIK